MLERRRTRPKKILVHDYSGHAFSAQLGRRLAARGHEVVYLSFADFGSPKGRVQATSDDPVGFRTREISFNAAVDKDNLVQRYRQQLRYARPAAEVVLAERPDAVLSGNAPVEVQQHLLRAARRAGARFVFWMQDVHAEAIGRLLGRRNRIAGSLAGRYYRALEQDVLRRSDRIVAISDDFRSLLTTRKWRIAPDYVDVVPNWAPIEDIPTGSRDNDWAARHYRPGRQRIVYCGTLERKHDPEILVRLAQGLDADVHLFSNSGGAKHVRQRAAALGLTNLFVAPWTGTEDFPRMLAGADVLCAFIEADAGVFSVPSKVLSYLAAGRPILASIPASNLAARTIRKADAGLVSEPGDGESMLSHARMLLGSEELRTWLGRNGRAHAEAHFDIERITDRFEGILALEQV